ncbi:MAG: hypothetical protein LBD76_06435 [Prevotellaceae bacterium]|jgi:hypothetical protein|nr:hypothetical protein [Prevotellaceae bacterium]
MELFILTLILIALCFAALGIRIWIKGEFTENEIGRNKNMRKLGLKCVKHEEIEQFNDDNDKCNTCADCSSFVTCGKLKTKN